MHNDTSERGEGSGCITSACSGGAVHGDGSADNWMPLLCVPSPPAPTWFCVQAERPSGPPDEKMATHPLSTPLCGIPSGCCSFTGPWTVTRSSLRMLRRVAAFCRPLRPVLLLVSFPRSWSPVVGVLELC